MSDRRIIIITNELGRLWRERNTRYYPGVCLEGLERTKQKLKSG
jgi:hypothetical protein